MNNTTSLSNFTSVNLYQEAVYCYRHAICYFRMSTLDLQREGLLWQHVALLTFYSSPEWRIQKLALKRAFVSCNFCDPP